MGAQPFRIRPPRSRKPSLGSRRSIIVPRPAHGSRSWRKVVGGCRNRQYSHILLRTRHVQADTLETGWLAAQWTEVALGEGGLARCLVPSNGVPKTLPFSKGWSPTTWFQWPHFDRVNTASDRPTMPCWDVNWHDVFPLDRQRLTTYGQFLLDELLVSKLLKARDGGATSGGCCWNSWHQQ